MDSPPMSRHPFPGEPSYVVTHVPVGNPSQSGHWFSKPDSGAIVPLVYRCSLWTGETFVLILSNGIPYLPNHQDLIIFQHVNVGKTQKFTQ